jgi:hypothetical protein
MQLTITPQPAPQRRRAARWTLRRRLACLVTEQLLPGRHYQFRVRA